MLHSQKLFYGHKITFIQLLFTQNRPTFSGVSFFCIFLNEHFLGSTTDPLIWPGYMYICHHIAGAEVFYWRGTFSMLFLQNLQFSQLTVFNIYRGFQQELKFWKYADKVILKTAIFQYSVFACFCRLIITTLAPATKFYIPEVTNLGEQHNFTNHLSAISMWNL